MIPTRERRVIEGHFPMISLSKSAIENTIGPVEAVKLTATRVDPAAGEVVGLFFELLPQGADAHALSIELWKRGADGVRRPMPVIGFRLTMPDGGSVTPQAVSIKGHDVASDSVDWPSLLALCGRLRAQAQRDEVPDFPDVLNAPPLRLVA